MKVRKIGLSPSVLDNVSRQVVERINNPLSKQVPCRRLELAITWLAKHPIFPFVTNAVLNPDDAYGYNISVQGGSSFRPRGPVWIYYILTGPILGDFAQALVLTWTS